MSLESWLCMLAPAILYGSDPQTAVGMEFWNAWGLGGGTGCVTASFDPGCLWKSLLLVTSRAIEVEACRRDPAVEQLCKGVEGWGLQARGWRQRWRWHWPHGRVDRRVRAAPIGESGLHRGAEKCKLHLTSLNHQHPENQAPLLSFLKGSDS